MSKEKMLFDRMQERYAEVFKELAILEKDQEKLKVLAAARYGLRNV